MCDADHTNTGGFKKGEICLRMMRHKTCFDPPVSEIPSPLFCKFHSTKGEIVKRATKRAKKQNAADRAKVKFHVLFIGSVNFLRARVHFCLFINLWIYQERRERRKVKLKAMEKKKKCTCQVTRSETHPSYTGCVKWKCIYDDCSNSWRVCDEFYTCVKPSIGN